MNETISVPDNQKIIRRVGVNNVVSNYKTIVPNGIGDKAQGKKSHVESVFADYALKQYAEIRKVAAIGRYLLEKWRNIGKSKHIFY